MRTSIVTSAQAGKHLRRLFQYSVDYLSSLTVTVIVLILLSVTTLISIMKSEIHDLLRDHQLLQGISVPVISRFFSFSDLSHSAWFTMLLELFAINLLLCTVKRIPGTLRTMQLTWHPAHPPIPPTVHLKDTIVRKNTAPDFEQGIRRLLSQKIAVPKTCCRDGSVLFFSQRGRYSHLGFYLAHGGLLLGLMGVIVSTFSYRGDMDLWEGEAADTFLSERGGVPCIKKLNFTLKLDHFETAYRPGRTGGSTEGPRITIGVLQNGKRVLKALLENYTTFTYHGMRIAISRAQRKNNYRVFLSVTPKRPGAQSRRYAVKCSEIFTIPETGHTIRVKSIFSPLGIHREDSVIRTSPDSLTASRLPLAKFMINLEVYSKAHRLLYSPSVFSHETRHAYPWKRDYAFSLLDVERVDPRTHCVRLNISFEPAGPFIWIGFALAIIGFSMMFLLSHLKCWVMLEETNGTCSLTLAGWTSRNSERLAGCFEDIREFAGRKRALRPATVTTAETGGR